MHGRKTFDQMLLIPVIHIYMLVEFDVVCLAWTFRLVLYYEICMISVGEWAKEVPRAKPIFRFDAVVLFQRVGFRRTCISFLSSSLPPDPVVS